MLNLAWRNIWRKRWRSGFTVLAVALVVYLSVFNFGLMGATKNSMYRGITDGVGHLQVRVQDYRDKREFDQLLVRNAGDIEKSLTTLVPEAELVKALEVGGLMEGAQQRSRGILLTGLDQSPSIQETFSKDYLVDGALPETGDVTGITLGVKLAQALKVGLGDTVYVYTFNTEGYGASAYDVIGLMKFPGSENMAFTSLLAAQELAAPDALSRIELHLPYHRYTNDYLVAPIKSELIPSIGTTNSIETWREVAGGFASYLELIDPINMVFTAIFFVLAGLVVANTLYLSIIERVREFGVMMALGLRRRLIFVMVLFESLCLCVSGALIGGALGVAHVVSTGRSGMTFPGTEQFFEEAGIPSIFYPSLSTGDVVATVIFVIITGVLAALMPALTAGRLEPVEAMRFTA